MVSLCRKGEGARVAEESRFLTFMGMRVHFSVSRPEGEPKSRMLLLCSPLITTFHWRKLLPELEQLGCKVYPSQTSFLYFDAHMDPQDLQAECAKRNILIGAFALSRVSIGNKAQNAAFISCLREILPAAR